MKILIAAVGKVGKGPERELVKRYLERIRIPIDLKEVDERRPLEGARRKALEADRLEAAIPAGAFRVALDERGKTFDSEDFAKFLEARRSQGINTLAFILGGADGLDKRLTESADLVLSLGAMTWPHLLARVMLAEQLYRATSILEGHPYHRR